MEENGQEDAYMKRVVQYRLNFDRKWLTASGMLMGLAFFVQALYFLGMADLQTVGAGTLMLYMIVPMALEAAWCILMRGARLDHGMVYGIIGALICVLLLVQSCFYGSTVRMVLGIVAYIFAGVTLLAITFGYFPYRLLGMVAFGMILLVRFFAFDIRLYLITKDWIGFLQEIPALCLIGAVGGLFGGMVGQRRKEE